ncbi:unnamed protein product, partial [Mesorhabditis spiculigera]
MYLICGSSCIFASSLMYGVEMGDYHFTAADELQYITKNNMVCAMAALYPLGVTITCAFTAGNAGMIFLIVHSYMVIINHQNMHKKVRELSLALLFSMSTQFAIFAGLTYLPFLTIIIFYYDPIFPKAWQLSQLVFSAQCVTCSIITIASSRVYTKFTKQLFFRGSGSTTPPTMVSAMDFRHQIMKLPNSRRSSLFGKQKFIPQSSSF